MKNKELMLLKRLFDFAVALVGLVMLSPVFLILSLMILLDDGGPVFFCQERVGRNGLPFILYKFRSMRVLKEAAHGRFDAGDSSRVTRAGRLLRKTKLDELPQLINVLKGEMSLVGPRPEVRKWVAVYPDRWSRVLTVAPGITDYASLEFRSEEELLSASEEPERTYREVVLPQKLELYEKYVRNWSFATDLRLIVLTIYSCVFK